MSAARGLTIVGASAGSGKTYRVTEVVIDAVTPSPGRLDPPLDPEALAAVTYTRRAAAELGARIRRALVASGRHQQALRMPLAYLGTVHAVCLRLVQEFALDAALSPQLDVLPGDEMRWLREAIEWGLDADFRVRLDALAYRMQVRWDSKRQRADWLTPVQDIMTLARSNRIPPSALPQMAERSAARLLALMGPAERDGDALDQELVAALAQADRDLAGEDLTVKKTDDARSAVRSALRDARHGELRWAEWVRLQHLEPAKKLAKAVIPVQEVAARVERHPRLQADVRELTCGIYEAARQGLEAYDRWKTRRRVVDFVDMIDRALALLERPAVVDELRGRLKLLVVDEFQDTSPAQLALFLRLHRITGRSTWVGDRKQCIFEFAGADPALMEAARAWAAESGGDVPTLEQNHRSRPELVDACSTLFASAFARHGYSPHEVVVRPVRQTPDRVAAVPPLGLWWLDASNAAEDAAALAEGVRRLLGEPAATQVVDRVTDAVRDVRASDVAILVATNKEAEQVAAALARRGIRATVARAGLLKTPEGTLAQAALSVLVDPDDRLSRAAVHALMGFEGQSPEAWLDARIAAEALRDGAKARGDEPPAETAPAIVARLEALRPRLEALAPSEAVDRVFAALDLPAICARWPDPEQRLANLDALRALTASYEARCAHQREAATIAGLLRSFEEAAQEHVVHDEEVASDDQHVGAGDHAVNIATYHKAKGLEWPVVVLSSLARGGTRDTFEVCPETDRAGFDPTDPLGGRWIRYWPWPFGQQQKTCLAGAAKASPEGLAVDQREERERVRLLYVGFTRARDHLILAARLTKRGPAVHWLDELRDARGQGLLALPATHASCEEATVEILRADDQPLRLKARHWRLDTGGKSPVRVHSSDAHRWFATPGRAPARASYWIAPSSASVDWPDLAVPEVAEVSSIGDRLPLGASDRGDWDVVGSAVHAFFAADVEGLERDERLARARRALAASRSETLLAADALLRASDQLRAWIDRRWPGAVWRREYPISAEIATDGGPRRVRGAIDLMLETRGGVVVVDHKAFPGGAAQWRVKAATFAPQLAAYARVLQSAGARVLGLYVHFTIGAGVVELR